MSAANRPPQTCRYGDEIRANKKPNIPSLSIEYRDWAYFGKEHETENDIDNQDNITSKAGQASANSSSFKARERREQQEKRTKPADRGRYNTQRLGRHSETSAAPVREPPREGKRKAVRPRKTMGLQGQVRSHRHRDTPKRCRTTREDGDCPLGRNILRI
jgi:hypothetical protein